MRRDGQGQGPSKKTSRSGAGSVWHDGGAGCFMGPPVPYQESGRRMPCHRHFHPFPRGQGPGIMPAWPFASSGPMLWAPFCSFGSTWPTLLWCGAAIPMFLGPLFAPQRWTRWYCPYLERVAGGRTHIAAVSVEFRKSYIKTGGQTLAHALCAK